MSVTRPGAAATVAPAPRVEIRKAYYEPANGRPGAALTAKVAELVAQGQY